jgi:uncharacterized protein with HEPN domain
MRESKIYLRDIFNAMISIESFVGAMDFDQFKEDDKTTSAVIRKLEIIGEAAKNIPQSITKKYSTVPWKEMAGMRDKLIHFYFGVSLKLVWQTVKHRIPQLKPTIKQLLDELDN